LEPVSHKPPASPLLESSHHRVAVLALAALLAAGMFVLAVISAPEIGALVFAPAAALIAFELGARAGAAAGLIASLLYLGAAEVAGSDVTVLGFSVRAVPLVLLGGAIGWLAEALRGEAAEAEASRRQVAKLAAERQRIAAEALNSEDRTRQRISELLHDRVLQALLATSQDLVESAAEDGVKQESLSRARNGVREAIRETRRAVFDLHPVALEHAGLQAAIEAVATHHAERSDLRLALELSEDVDRTSHDQLILSLVRELVANASKHAAGASVCVRLRRVEDQIALEIGDDGPGMEQRRPRDALQEGHIGLASSAQRVEALGGTFELETSVGTGTWGAGPPPNGAAHPIGYCTSADRLRHLPRADPPFAGLPFPNPAAELLTTGSLAARSGGRGVQIGRQRGLASPRPNSRSIHWSAGRPGRAARHASCVLGLVLRKELR
jgi:signal transduction histidine kinase